MFCPTVQQVNIYILAFFALDIVPFQEVFYLTFKVLSPEDGVLVPRCYIGFLLLDFTQLRGRRAMTNNLSQLYSWYAHMISAFAYTFWDKNYRVKSLRKKKKIYIYIYILLSFLSRTWCHKKVKDSVVFCKAYLENFN